MSRPRFAVLLLAALAVAVVAFLRGFEPGSAVEPVAAPSAESPSLELAPVEPALVPGAVAREPVPAPAGPHGRVLEAETGRPLAGLTVHLRDLARTQQETVTDEQGGFSFAPPDRARRFVEVVTEEWTLEPPRVRLDEDQTAGRTALAFAARRRIAAPVRGRLVDDITGEPVPDCLIRIRGPRVEQVIATVDGPFGTEPVPVRKASFPRTEDVSTDAGGRFASSESFEVGPLELLVVDHPSRLAEAKQDPIEHRHELLGGRPPPEQEIRSPFGPTYRFALTLPEGVEAGELVAVLPRPFPKSREDHRAREDSPIVGALVDSLFGTSDDPEAPLRPGAPPWVRFREPVSFRLFAAPRLLVRSRDGRWEGEATVDSVEGVFPYRVPVTLEPRGSIEGTVVDAEGEPVPSAWLRLEPATESPRPPAAKGADGRGRFAFRWLPSGEYALSVETDRYPAWSERIEVRAGEVVRRDVTLVADRPLGRIAGELRSRSGTYRAWGITLTLQSLEDPGFTSFRLLMYRRRGGAFVAPFAFEDLPVGEYELRLSTSDNLPWDGLQRIVVPPAEDLVLTCLDDAPLFDLELVVLDAATGEPIEHADSAIWLGDPRDERELQQDWESKRFPGVPENARLTWVVGARGHRLARGDESSVRVESGTGRLEVRLGPGWGQFFRVTTAEPELRPLAGVELVADGESIGRTDDRGLVFLETDAEPETLEFRCAGWHESWRSTTPEGLKQLGFGWNLEVPVYLSPDD